MKRTNTVPSLVFCIFMDLIGYATYTIPFFGEIGDLIWAPLSAVIFYFTFGGWKGSIGGVFNFVEELLPGTDFIPTFSVMWLIQYYQTQRASKKPVVA